MQLKSAIINYIEKGKGDFNQLALAAFHYQYTHCQAYQHYCQQLKRYPDQIQNWQQIPAVTTDVFREFELCTYDPTQAQYIFRTSGTTQEKTGKHYYQDMTLYDTVIRHSFIKGLRLKEEEACIFRILIPSFQPAKTSSLSYMLQQVVNWYGSVESKFYFDKDKNEIDYAMLFEDLTEDINKQRKIVIIGTAFSFINLFEYTKTAWQLPKGSTLMETGGLKGRVRETSRAELYHLFKTRLGIKSDFCFSEYGMTELTSQFYSYPDSHIFLSPAWMPVRIINPETNLDVKLGEMGLIQIFDLANLEAISAIQTSDLAIKHQQGFELVGRSPTAQIRGCSTAFEITSSLNEN